MDLSGSACASKSYCVSATFGCHTISRVYPSETVWAHFARTYHWAGENLTIWHHMRPTIPAELWGLMLSHTFWCTFGDCFGLVGWQKKNHKLMLPPYLRLRIFNDFSRALSCLLLSPFLPWLLGPRTNGGCRKINLDGLLSTSVGSIGNVAHERRTCLPIPI
jgi:hypothetical protein